MRSPFFGEFMGTMILVLLGNGTVASIMLKRSKAENAGWMAITTGWALAVLCGVFTATLCGSADAHLNPAITLAFAIKNQEYSKLLPYGVAQLLGAFAGSTLAWLHYFPHWAVTDGAETKLGIFCTGPAIRNPLANLFSEISGTAVLIVVAAAMSSKLVLSTGAAAGLSPWLVSCLVWGVGLGLGGTTGYAINPARDLGPRIAYSLLPVQGKGSADWAYAPIPVFGPMIGALLAGIFLRLLGA